MVDVTAAYQYNAPGSYSLRTLDGPVVGKGDYSVSLTGSQTLAQLVTTIPIGSSSVYIQPEGSDIRVARATTTPASTTVGIRVFDGTSFPFTGNLTALTLCPISGTVTVNLQFRG